MSKSFKEKRSYDTDLYESIPNHRRAPTRIKKKDKVIYTALKTRDIETLIKYVEDEE
jgi:hypothetical protein